MSRWFVSVGSVLSICVSLVLLSSGALAAEGSADLATLVARVAALSGRVDKSDAGQVVAIDLSNRAATDEDLRLLAAVPDLQKLTLWGPGITDAGLEQLAQLTNLTNLSLDNTAVTDAGL